MVVVLVRASRAIKSCAIYFDYAADAAYLGHFSTHSEGTESFFRRS